MKILAIYPNADGYNRVPTGFVILITLLLGEGHEVEVFDSTFLNAANRDNEARERLGLVKPTDVDHGYAGLSIDVLCELLRERLDRMAPDMVMATLVEDNYRYATRLLDEVKHWRADVPVVVGGPTPSAVPAVIVEHPSIDFVVQGEGEDAILELCQALRAGKPTDGIANLWRMDGGSPRGNPLRHFIDMDSLPIQDVSLWDPRHFVRPYDGKVYRTGFFESSRGCPFQCTYCVNHTIQRSLRSAGRYFRRRSPALTAREVRHHVTTYGLDRVVFCDDNFLLMPGRAFAEWSDEFRDSWREIGLPYWVTTSAEFIRPETARFLAETGCDGVGLGVEAGNEWFRRKVLRRTSTNEELLQAFRLLHEHGIRTTANVMIGSPGETEGDIFDSIKLIQALAPKSVDVSFVSPYIGTDIHRVARDLGYIDVLDEPGFRGMAREVSFRTFSSIRNPQISSERLAELAAVFMEYVNGGRPMPDAYRAPLGIGLHEDPSRPATSIEVAGLMAGY